MNLIYYLKKIFNVIKPFTNIVLAYSGGLDSTVLLFLLLNLKHIFPWLKIRAIHINHHLNQLSNKWTKNCQDQCNIWKIDLTIKHIFIKKINYKYLGIEATARFYRYMFFNKNLKTYEILLTGHHLEDLSESFLLALKRGTGPKGLSSIKQIRKVNKLIIISPMLYWSINTIRTLALTNKLIWIEDDSNFNINFDRNFIRYKLLPIIRQKWYFIDKLIARTSYLCQLQEQALLSLIKPLLNKYTDKHKSLYIKPLILFNKSLTYILIRYWCIQSINYIPSYIQIKYIYNNIIYSKYTKFSFFKLNNYYLLKRYKYKLYCILNKNIINNNKKKNIIISWPNLSKTLIIPYNGGMICQHYHGLLIRKPLLTEKVYIKFYLNNINNNYLKNKQTQLNKIWKHLNILPWQRTSIPLLFYNNTLIAALNFFITTEGKHGLTPKNGIKIKWLYKQIIY